MALTITALNNIQVSERDNIDDEGGWLLIVSQRFMRHAADIESGKVYDADYDFEFHVGNYTYFYNFIEWLKSITDDSADFHMLTKFSQDEGVLGSEACFQLKDAFLGWLSVAMTNDEKDKQYSDVYCRLLSAFCFVEDKGCLVFA